MNWLANHAQPIPELLRLGVRYGPKLDSDACASVLWGPRADRDESTGEGDNMDWGWLALAFYAGFSLAIVIIGLNY